MRGRGKGAGGVPPVRGSPAAGGALPGPGAPRPFHLLYALRYFRYGLVLCLVPMAQALLAFDLSAFYTALGQDAAILLAVGAASLVLRRATAFWLDGAGLHCETGIFRRVRTVYAPAALAALEVSRPVHCRLLAASKVTLYFKNYARPRTAALYLRREDAAALAQALLPVRGDVRIFAPTGFERLSLVMLSANLLTSCAFAWMTLERASRLMPWDLQALAGQNLARLSALGAGLLGTGASAAATLALAASTVTVLYSFVHTFGFRSYRSGGVLVSRGGLVTRIERRVALGAVSAVEVRRTPAARLLGRYPVYISAGAFRGGDIPLMVYRRGAPHTPQTLVPGYRPAAQPLCQPARKSPVQYLWRPAAALALCLGLTGAAAARMPGMLPVLALGDVLLAAGLAAAVEALFTEGLAADGRTVVLRFTRRFTRCEVCVLTPDIAYRLFETPFAAAGGRCDVTVYTPCGQRYRVRGALRHLAERMAFGL